ncbi:hypothetical protein NM688_g6787 [Phlebia brevispora]|uniref:Uncharacterized protein n=1 Tax=Phlebia brevispora TaxID=194682 RepID=A0ACC1SCI5_9APHY|nr:hypothetical protein NM688_g6787 [Phlebia brevispora]
MASWMMGSEEGRASGDNGELHSLAASHRTVCDSPDRLDELVRPDLQYIEVPRQSHAREVYSLVVTEYETLASPTAH